MTPARRTVLAAGGLALVLSGAGGFLKGLERVELDL